MVLFRGQDGQLAIKRVVATSGMRVAMQRNHLVVNERPLRYRPVEDQERGRISRGSLGTSLELEQGNGPELYISYSPGLGPYDSFGTVEVPADMFFLMGSNRDMSADSRSHGLVHRSRILGKVVGRGWAAGKPSTEREGS